MVRRQQPVGAFERKLAAALGMAGAPRAGEHLLVAVSGGPDSTALLAGLAALAPARTLRVTAAHVDHGLRGREGAVECARVADLARQLGVGFVSRAVVVAAGPGVEARARRARYAALGDMATEVGATRIVTGHTQDDQAETVMLRLLRGAGRRGLGGIRPVRGALFRPLLGVTRADVRRFLAERGLPFAVDRTNADLALARNRVRRLVLPFLAAEFNPRLTASLAALAARLRDEEDFPAAAAAARGASIADGDRLRATVAEEPPALARRIVRAWLERPGAKSPTASHVERVLGLATREGRGTVAIAGPGRVVREGEYLVRRPGRAAEPQPFAAPIAPGDTIVDPAGRWRLSLSAARARGWETVGLDLNPWASDYAREHLDLDVRCAPLEEAGFEDESFDAVTMMDLLEARAATAVLAAGGEVLWAAGLARGACAALGARTTRVVEGVFEAVE